MNIILFYMYYNDFKNHYPSPPIHTKDIYKTNAQKPGSKHQKYDLNISKTFCKNSLMKKSLDEQMIKQSLQCTFEPKINNNKLKRSIEKFLDDQDKFQEKKQEKIIELKQQKERNQCFNVTFVPKIDEKSKRIIDQHNGKRDISIFQRLSKEKLSKENLHPECPFSPNILKKSHQLHRKSDISILLYQDAKRRQSKESFLSQCLGNNNSNIPCNPKVSLKTNKLVINKYLLEFESLLTQQELTPLTAILLLEDLFNADLNPSKSHQNNIAVKKILNFVKTKDQCNVQKIDLQKMKALVTNIICIQQPSLLFTKEQQIQIHENFKHFYFERLAKQKKVPVPQKFEFKPKTLKSSQALAQNYRQKQCKSIQKFIETQQIKLNVDNGYAIEDLFIINHMKKKMENQQKRLQKEQIQLKQCTFTPNTIQSKKSMEKIKDNMKQNKIILKPKRKSTTNLLNKTQLINKTQKIQGQERSKDKIKINPLPPKGNKQNINIQKSKDNAKQLKQNMDKQMDKVMLRMAVGRQRRQFENRLLTRGYPKDENWNDLQHRMHRKSVQNDEILKNKLLPNK